MGTKTQGTRQSSSIPTAGNGNLAMPVSIAPSALAEHLDDGWGEEEAEASAEGQLERKPERSTEAHAAPHVVHSTLPSVTSSATALAPARLPTFDAPAKATKAAASDRITTATAALKARRPVAMNANATLTGGFYAQPRSSNPARPAPNASASILDDSTSEPALDDAGAEPVVITETIAIAAPLASPRTLSSVPPTLDDDADWDLPATDTAVALPSSAPTPLVAASTVRAKSKSAAKAANAAAATRPEIPAAKHPSVARLSVRPAALAKAKASATNSTEPLAAAVRSDSERPNTSASRSGSPPASGVSAEKAAPSARAAAQAMDPKVAAPLAQVAILDRQLDAPASPQPEAPELEALSVQAIDITIPPSFPQSHVDAEGLGRDPALHRTASDAPIAAVSSSSEHQSQLGYVDANSMSPVTTSEITHAGRSKLWLMVAVALTVVGVAWGLAGMKQAATRQSTRDAVTVVPEPKAPAVAVAAQQPNQAAAATEAPVGVEPTVAAPPATATVATVVDSNPPAAVSPAAAAPDADGKKPKRRLAAASAPAVAAPAVVEAGSEAAALPPASQAMGQSTPALNAPVSPTGGIVDPKAFPGNSGTTVSKVRVEVDPPDSKVAVHGKAATAPYQFDIPKGSRVVLEVAHTGYITRRIVLDGSRELVRISMIPEPKVQDTVEDPPKGSDVPSAP